MNKAVRILLAGASGRPAKPAYFYHQLAGMFKDLGFFRWCILVLNGMALSLLMASYAAPYLDPARYWYIALFGTGHFWLVIVNLAFALLWLMLRWKIALIPLLVLLVGFSYHLRVFSPISAEQQPPKDRQFKLMSYNVQLFKLYNWTHNKDIRNRMLDYIVSERCDVLCFQEYFYADKEYFNTTDTLLQIQPARHVHFEAGVVRNGNHYFGLATFSRFPIVGKGVIRFRQEKDRTNLAMYSDLLIGGDTLRVYNVHLASNHLNTREVDDMLGATEKTWKITRTWLRKLRNGYRLRARQVLQVSESIRKSPHPVVVCGDFNDVPVSYTYRVMSRGLKDAFVGSGKGLGATYNGRLPNLRIDYILHSPSLNAYNFTVVHKDFTDHFPVTCKIGWEE